MLYVLMHGFLTKIINQWKAIIPYRSKTEMFMGWYTWLCIEMNASTDKRLFGPDVAFIK